MFKKLFFIACVANVSTVSALQPFKPHNADIAELKQRWVELERKFQRGPSNLINNISESDLRLLRRPANKLYAKELIHDEFRGIPNASQIENAVNQFIFEVDENALFDFVGGIAKVADAEDTPALEAG